MNLKEKVAVVTGAKSGIGLATAARFVVEGAKVVLVDIREAYEEAAEMRGNGKQALFLQADVSEEMQVATLIRQAVAAYGRIDILVNNAGIELAKRVPETSVSDWDRVMNVNLKGVYLCSKEVILIMRHQKGGVIINVASELGLVGGSEIAAYSASKGGVVQITKSMAIDHAADGIRVNCVAPGPTATPLLESIIASAMNPEHERHSIVQRTILKRLGRPEEIANVIVFAASDEASYMTGSVIAVDGGWTAQ